MSAMAIKKCASFCAPALSGRNWTTTSSNAPAITTAQMGPRDDFFFDITTKIMIDCNFDNYQNIYSLLHYIGNSTAKVTLFTLRKLAPFVL